MTKDKLPIDLEGRLIRQALEGAPEAFSELVRAHQANVRGCIARYVLSPDIVDDLAQETFVRAFTRLSTYKGESPFGAWLFGIARNAALHHLRDREVRRSQETEALEARVEQWMAGALETDPAATIEAQDRQLVALETCIESLPSPSAQLVTEFYFNHRKAGDIARKVGRTEGSVWVALLRIRQALRRCVETRLGAVGADG